VIQLAENQSRQLVLHLGFPKTGTTSLQDSFFPQVKGYLGKVSDRRIELEFTASEQELSRALGYYHSLPRNGGETLGELVERLPFHASPTILISNEAFCRWPVSLRPGAPWSPVNRPLPFEPPRKGTHPMIAFLAELREALPEDVDLLTIISLRAQQTYLPSQAAQRGEQSIGRIIRRLARSGDEYVYWDQVVHDLEQLRGPSKHLTLLFEDGLEFNAGRIVKFGSLTPKLTKFDLGSISHANSRSQGQSWNPAEPRRKADRFAPVLKKFARVFFRNGVPAGLGDAYLHARESLHSVRKVLSPLSRKPLTLTTRQRSTLQDYVRESNITLGQMLQRDLDRLGY